MADTRSGASGESSIDLAELLGTGETPAAAPVDGSGVMDGLGREPADGHRVDPHEQLDMTDMGEMDKLLHSLDLPQRPNAVASAGADITAELDSAVDEVLNSMDGMGSVAGGPGASSAAADAAQTGDDDILADLLAEGGQPAATASDANMAALLGAAPARTAPPAPAASAAPAPVRAATQGTSPDDGIIDLTELIEKGPNSAAFAPPAEDIGSHMRGLNDASGTQGSAEVDALLARMTGGSEQGASAPASNAGDALGEMDRLLDSLNPPQQPQRPVPAASLDADVDSAVDEILNSMNVSSAGGRAASPTTPPAAPLTTPVAASRSGTAVPAADGDILADLLAQGKPESVDGASGAAADVDALLGDLGMNDAPAASAAPSMAAPAAAGGDVDDLDALLGDMGLGQTGDQPAEPSAAPAAAGTDVDDLDALLGDIGLGQTGEQAADADSVPLGQDAAGGPDMDDLDALLAAEAPAAHPEAEMGLAPQPDAAAGPEAELAAGIAAGLAAAAAMPEASVPVAPAALAAPAISAEDWAGLLSRLEAAETAAQQLEQRSAILEGRIPALEAAGQRITALEERLVVVEDDSGRASALEQRLAALEDANQGVGALEERLAGLEAAGEASGQVLARLEGAADGLEARLAALEAAGKGMASLEERVATLEMAEKSAADAVEQLASRLAVLEGAEQRASALEERLARLEARFSQEVEQAAAAAAARILREEIARLLEESA